jgi:hypothetical protein
LWRGRIVLAYPSNAGSDRDPGDADAGPESNTDVGGVDSALIGADAEADPDAYAAPRRNTHAEAEPDRYAGSRPIPHADSRSDPDSHSRADTHSDTDSRADSQADADTRSNADLAAVRDVLRQPERQRREPGDGGGALRDHPSGRECRGARQNGRRRQWHVHRQ